jgi:hypothetical protein
VVLSTPGKDDGGISGMAGSAGSGEPLSGRRAPTDAGLETRRRTASGVGRLDTGGVGRVLDLGFAVIRRGRGVGGIDEGDCSASISSTSSSAGVIR